MLLHSIKKIRCDMKSRRILLLLVGVGLLTVGMIFFFTKKYSNDTILISNCENIILDCYEQEICDLSSDGIYSENGVDYANPWIMAANGIHYVKNGDKATAEKILGRLMQSFYNYNCFPRDKYLNFEQGWVSCMDAPTVAVLAQILYEKTGEKTYQKYVYDLIPYMMTESYRGGIVLALIIANGYLSTVINLQIMRAQSMF